MFERRSELEKLVAVAEAGKIVAAADRLAMTQSALTRAIARLECRFTAERAFGLGLLMLDQVLETYDVRCPKRVQADPLTRRALDPDDPTLPAYLDRDVQRVVLRADRRDDVATWGHLVSPVEDSWPAAP